MQSISDHFIVESREHCNVIHLISTDRMNRLTLSSVRSMKGLLDEMREAPNRRNAKPLIITGNEEYFSVGADLNEIAALTSTQALDFAKCGQEFMSRIDHFPAPVYAAIWGYCMGGGLDVALACDFRVCAANTIFGHRGAALGLLTGWSGTQRLTKLIGRSKALQMFAAAETLGAAKALDIGLVSEVAVSPLARCMELIAEQRKKIDEPNCEL